VLGSPRAEQGRFATACQDGCTTEGQLVLDPTMQAIQTSLDGLAARQRIEATNLANSETPGYTAQTVSFEDSLSSAIANGSPSQAQITNRLEPTITWAVVDASIKAEDVGHRITLLGGVDVIAMTGIADTISPAAILGLNIPVGRIGSNPATPAVWADLLLERLDR
jgi:hypothetical protein